MSKKPLLLIALGVVLIISWYVTSQRFFAPRTDQTPSVTSTPSGSQSQLPDVTRAQGESTKQRISIYLVAVDDEGKSGTKIGCGDSLIPVVREVTPTKAVLQASLTQLFSLNDQYYGESGLYNALYRSDLEVVSAVIENGKATIRLSGQLSLGGVCDNPRVEGQIRATAEQFESVQAVDIFLNGQPLEESLSQQ